MTSRSSPAGTARTRWPLLLLAGALGLGGLLSCTERLAERDLEPTPLLLDEAGAPRILVERSRIDFPPSSDANRVLGGWHPWRYEDRTALGASPRGARLQMVQLAARERSLWLDLVEVTAPGGGVRVRAAGRDLGVFALTDPLEIPLPADLPSGRVVVELTPVGSPPPPLDVLEIGVRPVLPEGGVERDGRDLVQSGDSRVEWVTPVSTGQTLVGELVPPKSPHPEQRFRITVERDDRDEPAEEPGPLHREQWLDGADRRRGSRRIALPAGKRAGWVRVTLEARGPGPPVRWRDLHWTADGQSSTTPEGTGEAGGSAGSAPKPPRVVVLYVMDALRADFVGHLGGPPGISPTWDRLAREGVTFRGHRSVAPSTLPSTRALFSGHVFRFPEEHAAIDRMPLLAERFHAAGYRTGLFSGNGFVSSAYGLDRGFDHVAHEVLYGPDSPAERGGVNVNAARVQQAALAWLDSLGPGERAFLYLHTIHPHNPYAPPPDLSARFAPDRDSPIDGSTATLKAVQNRKREVGEADRRRLRGLYAAAFAYNDRELAKLIAALEARFGDGQVLVILTSDHGEELFEHDGVLHGHTLYEEMLRIPMTFWWPGTVPPAHIDRPTDSLDLHATLLDLVGAGASRESSGAHDGPDPSGRSLWAQILGTGDTDALAPRLHFAAAPGVRGGIFSVTGGWEGSHPAKLVMAAQTRRWGVGKGRGRSWDPEYFFDLVTDPGEHANRVGAGGLDELRLYDRLRAWIDEGERLRRQAGPVTEREVDAETRERLRSLGYLQ